MKWQWSGIISEIISWTPKSISTECPKKTLNYRVYLIRKENKTYFCGHKRHDVTAVKPLREM